eukprot:TRINITY_DN9997_c0_g1_i1.p1 TRINITY_DN9997_c0_g1~~TRINITY_DN9997_c0_g1_i1.p1  ORF type:complete len:511 (+),score=146.60 TRINITY_DN9997_c0_g1_i1:69-1535(+)
MAGTDDDPCLSKEHAWRWMVPLAFVFLNESISLTMLFPFVGYMVADFGVVESKDQAGVYAGMIASMFVLGQLCTMQLWGTLSDSMGRRPAIFAGLAATGCLAPFFGLSSSLWQAMLVRFVMGLLNGNQGVAKAYVGDVVTKETEDMGFSMIAVTWGVGNIVGASAGGFLARPALSWPQVFEGTFLETYPYLLPCLASSIFAFIGLTLSYKFLPDIKRRSGQAIQSTAEGPYSYVLRRRRCRTVLAIFFCISYLDYGMFEVYPLWCITSIPGGGLDWGTQQVGLTQLLGGLFLIAGNMVIFPFLKARLPALLSQKIGILGFCLPGFSLFPLAAVCCAGSLWAYGAVLPVLFLRIVGPGIVFTLTFQFINSMVRDRRVLGGVTGVGQQVGCLARVISPTLSAKLFAWGNRSTLDFPLDRHVAFVFFGVSWLVPLFLNLRLRQVDVDVGALHGTDTDSEDDGTAEEKLGLRTGTPMSPSGVVMAAAGTADV